MSSETEESQDEKSFFNIIVHSFFVIPFLIAVFCVLLFAAMHLLTRENRTVYDYLEDVKTGGLTKRWQGAFELSKILANPDILPEETRFYDELKSAFKHSQHDDARVRQYLALAMGRTGKAEFTQTLVEALPDAKAANKTAIIYSLGMLGQKDTAKFLYEYLDDPEPRIRSITTVALGNIGNIDSKKELKKVLYDKEPNVQWGAAISLAQFGDSSGIEILKQLMDRSYLDRFNQVDPDEQTNLMISAINASAHLDNQSLLETIRQLAKNDKNMKVRSAAYEVLETQK